MEVTVVGQEGQQVLRHGGAVHTEAFVLGKGQLEGGAAQVVEQNEGIIGVDEGALGAGRAVRVRSPQVVGVGHDVLVEGTAAGHQKGCRRGATSPRAARLLPRAGDTAGVTRHNHSIQPADIHSQFQSVGSDDAAQRAIA